MSARRANRILKPGLISRYWGLPDSYTNALDGQRTALDADRSCPQAQEIYTHPLKTEATRYGDRSQGFEC